MSEEINTYTYTVATHHMDRLNKEVAKLNKRADKIGCDPISIVVIETKQIPHPEIYQALLEKYNNLPKSILDAIPTIEAFEVQIVGTGPKIDGYKFVGTLDHYTMPGKVIVSTVPGEHIPPTFFNAKPICDHCNKIRSRIETFIVENENDKVCVQVGRNCLKDFFGHDVNVVVRWMQRLNTLMNELDDNSYISGGSHYVYNFLAMEALTNTIAVVRKYGWISKAKSDTGHEATSSTVAFMMIPQTREQDEKMRQELIASLQFEPQDLIEATAAVEWLRTQSADNEYMHNLKLLEDQPIVSYKLMGYWCSLIATYHRVSLKLEEEKRERETKLNEHIGSIKDRIEMQVNCVNISHTDGYYGTICIHRMLDTDGRTVIWFANADAKMEPGSNYNIKATIKKHDEYKDWKQTIVTRLAVLNTISTPVDITAQ
jgi:hypothetical protein